MVSDIGLHDLKHVWKGIVERMIGVLGGNWTEVGFALVLFLGAGRWE